MAITKVTSSVLSSGSATDGYVLTADGSGNSAWEAAAGGGVDGIVSSADATAITIDSSERVGIGTGSPDVTLHVANAGDAYFKVQNTSASKNAQIIVGGSGARLRSDDVLIFDTGSSPAERMRITSNGEFLLNRNSIFGAGDRTTCFIQGKTDGALNVIGTNTSGYSLVAFFNGSLNVMGSITHNNSSVTYGTSSDYRLKENVEYDWDATTRLKQLRPSRFNFIADPDTTVDGFLAHEVQDIVPEAITGVRDEMQEEEYEVTPAVLDEDGNVVTEAVMGTREVPKYQNIDQSKLVPLLTKALQEQQTIIEDLQARIETLENA